MHKKAVHVVKAQTSQRFIKTPFDVFGFNKMRPDFSRDENLLALNTRIHGQPFSKCGSNLCFIGIATSSQSQSIFKFLETEELTTKHSQGVDNPHQEQ